MASILTAVEQLHAIGPVEGRIDTAVCVMPAHLLSVQRNSLLLIEIPDHHSAEPLMNPAGQTDHFTPFDYARKIEEYLGGRLDHIIYNNEHPSPKLLKKYMQEGEHLVLPDHVKNGRFIGDKLIRRQFSKTEKGDNIKRNLIRHNPERLANLIIKKILFATR